MLKFQSYLFLIVNQKLVLLPLPELPVPNLRVVGNAYHHDILPQLCVVPQMRGDKYPALLVGRDVRRLGEEIAFLLAGDFVVRKIPELIFKYFPFVLGICAEALLLAPGEYEPRAQALAQLGGEIYAALFVKAVLVFAYKNNSPPPAKM